MCIRRSPIRPPSVCTLAATRSISHSAPTCSLLRSSSAAFASYLLLPPATQPTYPHHPRVGAQSHASLEPSVVCCHACFVLPSIEPAIPYPHRTMAAPANCQHSFKMIKSDTTLILWNCNMCHSGPHSFIYECQNCKLKTCRPCTAKA